MPRLHRDASKGSLCHSLNYSRRSQTGLLLVKGAFYLLLFNLAFIQSAPGDMRLRRCSCFVGTFCDRAHWARGVGMCSAAARFTRSTPLLSSSTKRNWIPQNPTQAVRFNRAFKHSHWLLCVGFVRDYSTQTAAQLAIRKVMCTC